MQGHTEGYCLFIYKSKQCKSQGLEFFHSISEKNTSGDMLQRLPAHTYTKKQQQQKKRLTEPKPEQRDDNNAICHCSTYFEKRVL